MKKKILIFSESIVYSGSENVIENIMLSQSLNLNFEIEFLYSYNRRYHKRFLERAMQFGITLNNVKAVKLLTPDADVYSYNLEKQLSIIKVWLFVKVIFLKILKVVGVSHIFNFFVLRHHFKKSSPNILYINNGGYPASLQCCLAVFVAKNLNLKKIVFNINNMATHRVKWFEKNMDRYIGKNVDTFITASYAAQECAVLSRGLPKEKFERVPNTVFQDHLLYNWENQASLIETNKIIFGSVGLLTERKGYAVLIDAVNELVNNRGLRNIIFNIVGEGEDRLLLKSKIDKFELNAEVHLMGFKRNPIELVKNFDAFILPSTRNEDFPYVILEAMTLAKPIIGTYVAGIPEQIADGKNGYLIPASDPIALADAIERLAKSATLRKNMGLKSQELYRKQFSYEVVIEKYLEIFND